MANIKITDLQALNNPKNTDVLPIVDISRDETRKVTIADLLENAGEGSVTNAGFAFDGDPNTGMYHPSDDVLGFTAGGTQALRIESTGVIVPGNLTVEGTTTTIETTNLVIEDKNIQLATVTTPTNTTADGGGITLKGATDKTITWVNSTGCWTFNQPMNFNNHVRIDSSGNVGIGTTSPQAPFVISNSGAQGIEAGYSAGTSTNFIQAYNRSSSAFIQLDVIGNPLVFKTGSGATERMKIDSSGNIGIGGAATATASTKTLQVTDSTTARMLLESTGTGGRKYGWYTSVDGQFAVYDYTANSERLRINSAGQAIIGGTSALDSDKQLTLTTTSTSGGLGILSPNNGRGDIFFGDAADDNIGQIKYSHVDDSLTIRTNAADRFTIDSSGRVGIGTSDPSVELSLAGSDPQLCLWEGTDGASSSKVQLGTGTVQGFVNIHKGDGTRTIQLNSDGDTYFTGGNIGCGTTSPAAKTHISNSYSAPTNGHDSNLALIVSNSGSANNYAGIGIAAGNNAASFIHFGDTDDDNVGALNYFHDTNSLTFVTAATERLRITSGGSVGIGQTNPSGKLEVNGGYVTLRSGASSFPDGISAPIIYGSTGGGSGTFDQTGNLVLQTRSDAGNYSICMVTGDTPTERLRVDSSGNLGIGDSSPANTLSVLGASTTGASSTGNVAEFAGPSNTNGFQVFVNDTNNNSGIQTKNGDALVINPHGGNVGIGTTSPQRALVVSDAGDEGFEFYPGSSDTGNTLNHYDRGSSAFIDITTNADQHIFGRADGEKMRIDSSGRLLVGLSSSLLDYSQLQLSGGSDGTGHICFARNSAAPTSGQNIGSQRFTNSAGGIGAIIGVEADANWTAGSSFPSRIIFATTASSASSPTERMRIDSSGNVGIGATSADAKLHVAYASGNPQIIIERTTSSTAKYGLHAFSNTFTIRDEAQSTERLRIDSSGRLLVGTTSSSTQGKVVIVGNSNSSTGEGELHLARGATPTSQQNLGNIHFGGVGLEKAAQIICKRDGGTWTSGSSHPSRLEFLTTADGASSSTERMRIDEGGKVYIGSGSTGVPHTSTGDDDRIRIKPNEISAVAYQASPLKLNRTGDDGTIIQFRREGSSVGTISVTSSAVAYNTTSDYRLKENVVELADGITRVKQLAPKRFNFIVDADTTVDGFLAHEAQAVVPEAVTGERDGEEMQGIDQSKLVPLLTAALQEAIAKIETLEQRLTDAGL